MTAPVLFVCPLAWRSPVLQNFTAWRSPVLQNFTAWRPPRLRSVLSGYPHCPAGQVESRWKARSLCVRPKSSRCRQQKAALASSSTPRALEGSQELTGAVVKWRVSLEMGQSQGSCSQWGSHESIWNGPLSDPARRMNLNPLSSGFHFSF